MIDSLICLFLPWTETETDRDEVHEEGRKKPEWRTGEGRKGGREGKKEGRRNAAPLRRGGAGRRRSSKREDVVKKQSGRAVE